MQDLIENMQALIVVTRRALVISNPPCRFPLHRPLYNIPGTRNPSPTSIRIHSLTHPDHRTTTHNSFHNRLTARHSCCDFRLHRLQSRIAGKKKTLQFFSLYNHSHVHITSFHTHPTDHSLNKHGQRPYPHRPLHPPPFLRYRRYRRYPR